MPLLYKITASWGNHEGSMLLFLLLLNGYNFLFINFSKYKTRFLVSSIQSLIIFLFGIYIYFVSDPFMQFSANIPTEGGGLNPILQDFALSIHPPLLYLGYAGFSLSYSIAMAAIITQEKDEDWVLSSKTWSLIAFAFLSMGVLLGSWWAYRELGWGGYWFWDPVENTSLLPWLVSLALIHSLLSSKKFGLVKNLTFSLSTLTFIISGFGFFIVRSGILSSVHSFATDPIRGIFMLLLIVLITIWPLYFLTKKGLESKKSPIILGIISRHGLILINIMLLLVLAFILVMAILYPIILEIFFETKISVGEPYFNLVYIPISLILLFFMVYTPYIKWPRETLKKPFFKSAPSLIMSLVLSVIIYYLYPQNISLKLLLAITLSLWVIISLSQILITRSIKGDKISRGFLAMCVSHIGFGLLGVSISLNAAFEDSLQKTIKLNEEVEIAGFKLTPETYEVSKGENYFTRKVNFHVKKADKEFNLTPENRVYMPKFTKTYESDILSTIFYDFYIVMGESSEENEGEYLFQAKIYYKPFIGFIWLSAVIIAVGALIAAIPKNKQKQA